MPKVMVPGKATAPKPSVKLDPVSIATKAVKEYEQMAEDLSSARGQFENQYPEAKAELERIDQFRSEVVEHVEKTKILVREAGQTIGPFEFTAKFSKPGYDSTKMVEVLTSLTDEELGQTFRSIAKAGLVKSLEVDRDVMKVFFPHNQDLAALFEPAYDGGGKALTPAIKTPKVD